MIYEGDGCPLNLVEGRPRIDLKLIDFAHTMHNSECDGEAGVDPGVTRGLNFLIECQGNILLDGSNTILFGPEARHLSEPILLILKILN